MKFMYGLVTKKQDYLAKNVIRGHLFMIMEKCDLGDILICGSTAHIFMLRFLELIARNMGFIVFNQDGLKETAE